MDRPPGHNKSTEGGDRPCASHGHGHSGGSHKHHDKDKKHASMGQEEGRVDGVVLFLPLAAGALWWTGIRRRLRGPGHRNLLRGS